MNGNNGYSGNDITPEILNYSELCTGNCRIEPQLYIEHKVNRGLRDLNGKGVLTGAAVIGMIDWKILVSALVVFIVICVCTRYVSLSSIAASGVIILMAFVLYGKSIATLGGASVIIMCTVMGAMVVIRHKSNIVRLIKGNERKLGEKKE